MVLKDKRLKKIKPKTLKAIIHAVRAHRSSDKSVMPRSQMAKIINDADRLDSSLGRALVYRLKKNPEMPIEEALLASACHQSHKFGPRGYGLKATYFPLTRKTLTNQHMETVKAFRKKDVKKLKSIAEGCTYYKTFHKKKASERIIKKASISKDVKVIDYKNLMSKFKKLANKLAVLDTQKRIINVGKAILTKDDIKERRKSRAFRQMNPLAHKEDLEEGINEAIPGVQDKNTALAYKKSRAKLMLRVRGDIRRKEKLEEKEKVKQPVYKVASGDIISNPSAGNNAPSKKYIDWDSNYGKTFRLAITPEGAQSNSARNTVSIVTPSNLDAWKWPEAKANLAHFKKNWDTIQKTLGDYKYNQIVHGASAVQTPGTAPHLINKPRVFQTKISSGDAEAPKSRSMFV